MTHKVLEALGINGALISKETRLYDFLPIDRYDKKSFQKRISKAEYILGIKIDKDNRILTLIERYNENINAPSIYDSKNHIKK